MPLLWSAPIDPCSKWATMSGKTCGAVDREAHDCHEAEHDDDEADQGQQGEHDRHRQQQTSPPA